MFSECSESGLDPREQNLALASKRENSVGPLDYGTGVDGNTLSDPFNNKGRYESLYMVSDTCCFCREKIKILLSILLRRNLTVTGCPFIDFITRY